MKNIQLMDLVIVLYLAGIVGAGVLWVGPRKGGKAGSCFLAGNTLTRAASSK